MDDHQFKQLLEFFNRSWKGYRKVRRGVKNRIGRHMQSVGCRQMDAYLHLLKTSAAARRTCERLLTVSISRFYRDRQVWQLLSTNILPDLAGQNSVPLRIWSAGCARGEEVYSLKIAWEEVKSRGGRRWSIRPELKKGVKWICRDLLDDPPPANQYNLILLRNNLLTYYQDPEISAGLRSIMTALMPAGFLIIGAFNILSIFAMSILVYPIHLIHSTLGFHEGLGSIAIPISS